MRATALAALAALAVLGLAAGALPAPAAAQHAAHDEHNAVPTVESGPPAEVEAVKAVVTRLFDAMRAHDAAMVRSVFHADARFVTVGERDGEVRVAFESPEGFATAVGEATQLWDERVTSWQVSVDDRVASVWTGYEFWLDGAFSHCGIDSFELVKTADGWKMTQLADTRRTEGCPGR